MRDRIDAAAFALGAFAIPYLAAGLRRFAGYNWWRVLVWPKEAGSLWGPLGFELGGFAVVAALVYWLRLRALGESTIWRDVAHGALKANAALTGGAVFLVLYLAVGVGLHGTGFGNVRGVLTWPYQWRALHVAVLVVLAAFAGVSLFVWWLKGRYLLAEQSATEAAVKRLESIWQMPQPEPQAGAQTGELEAELAALRDQVKSLRDNLDNSTRQSAQARMRAAEAEAKLRKLEQNAGGSPSPGGAAAGRGGDAKFKLAKRAFARIVHPDMIQKDGIEKTIRTEIYKALSRELEAIDDDKT